MKKKGILALLLAFLMVFNGVIITSGANITTVDMDNKRIEIVFRVGDSVLQINGNKVAVETPYVLNGTTLVPLRVITEAFGAEVEWNGEARTVTLKYAEVTIVLTIGDKKGKVNDQILELLEAPEIKNDVTMVPLRFITENFGADVTYNEDTKEITVVKEITDNNGILDYGQLLNHTDKEKIGDSYWNWSMPLPKKMGLAYRSFDGSSNLFANSDGSASIMVQMQENIDNLSMDEIFALEKDSSKSYTLISEDRKQGAEGLEYACMNFKDKESTAYRRVTVANNTIYIASLVYKNSVSAEEQKDGIAVIDGFAVQFGEESITEDLSDANPDGFRIYSNKDMKFTIKIPSEYKEYSDQNKTNEFLFGKIGKTIFDDQSIGISIYSDIADLSSWAQECRTYDQQDYNTDMVKFTEITGIQVNGMEAKSYSYTIPNGDASTLTQIIFLQRGNYYYKIAITMPKVAQGKISAVINSFSCNELDKNTVGQLSRSKPSESVLKTVKSDGFSWDIPVDWKVPKDSKLEVYIEPNGYGQVQAYKLAVEGKYNFSTLVSSFQESLRKEKKITIIQDAKALKVGNLQAYNIKYTGTSDELGNIVGDLYLIQVGDNIQFLEFNTIELMYGQRFQSLIEKIVGSVKFDA